MPTTLTADDLDAVVFEVHIEQADYYAKRGCTFPLTRRNILTVAQPGESPADTAARRATERYAAKENITAALKVTVTAVRGGM
jgi:hypothetical protein